MDLLSITALPALVYLLIAGMVAVDAAFPAIPADITVVSAGALAAAGQLHLGWAAAAVVIGAVGGDHLVYTIGQRGMPGVLARFRLGRRLRNSATRAFGTLTGVGTATLAMGRFVPFGRTATAASAGLADVPRNRYIWISVLGASAWAAWTLGLGYVTGQAAGGPVWWQVAAATAVGVGVAVVIAAVQRLVGRRRRR